MRYCPQVDDKEESCVCSEGGRGELPLFWWDLLSKKHHATHGYEMHSSFFRVLISFMRSGVFLLMIVQTALVVHIEYAVRGVSGKLVDYLSVEIIDWVKIQKRGGRRRDIFCN